MNHMIVQNHGGRSWYDSAEAWLWSVELHVHNDMSTVGVSLNKMATSRVGVITRA